MNKETIKEKRQLGAYSLNFKQQVEHEIETNQWNKYWAGHRYNIPHTTIDEWIKKYGTMANPEKDTLKLSFSLEEKLQALEFENKNLRSLLRKNSILLEKLEKLIETTERELNIRIRKRPGRSPKLLPNT